MGSPDNAWGLRTEHLLTAAILRVDTQAIAQRIANNQGALDVRTGEVEDLGQVVMPLPRGVDAADYVIAFLGAMVPVEAPSVA